MRLLHQRLGDDAASGAEEESEGERCELREALAGLKWPLRHARRDQCAPSSARNRQWSEETPWTRREFLKTSGALVVSLRSRCRLRRRPGKPPFVPGELDSWIAVLPMATCRPSSARWTWGRGWTSRSPRSWPKSSDVGFDEVAVFMGDTGSSCNQGGASGAPAYRTAHALLRRAAAEARRVLVERGAEKLKAPVAQLRVEDGTGIGPQGKPRTRISSAAATSITSGMEQATGNPMDISRTAKPKAPADTRWWAAFAAPRRGLESLRHDEFITLRVRGMSALPRHPSAPRRVQGAQHRREFDQGHPRRAR